MICNGDGDINMNAEIITIGTEVTTGSILNTNVQFLSNELLDLGIETLYHTSVDDNEDRLKEVINISLNRVDLIITTGGLGPTDDDLTKEVIADVLNLKLLKDIDTENKIKEIFNKSNSNMPINNLKQAINIEGGKLLNNSMGTAPGIVLYVKDKIIIMLPGPPREMKEMFINEVITLLEKNFHIIKRSINLMEIGESLLEMEIKDLLNRGNGVIAATFAKDLEVEIKLIGKGSDIDIINKEIMDIVNIIEDRFPNNIFGYDNMSIELIVFKMLKELNYKVGFCESCTGGLISSKFSGIPGASEVFNRSIITYSNEAKIEEVGVKNTTLENFGAVSKETALEMATGLLDKADLDLTLSITGIAGPDGGTKEKPVGLVYICIATKHKTKVIECNFTGNRKRIQNKAATKAFNEIRKFLLNNN